MTRKRSMKTPLALSRVAELDAAKRTLYLIERDNDFRGAAARDAATARRAIVRIFQYDDDARHTDTSERLS